MMKELWKEQVGQLIMNEGFGSYNGEITNISDIRVCFCIFCSFFIDYLMYYFILIFFWGLFCFQLCFQGSKNDSSLECSSRWTQSKAKLHSQDVDSFLLSSIHISLSRQLNCIWFNPEIYTVAFHAFNVVCVGTENRRNGLGTRSILIFTCFHRCFFEEVKQQISVLGIPLWLHKAAVAVNYSPLDCITLDSVKCQRCF